MLVSIVLPCYNPPANWDTNIIAEYTKLKNIISDDLELILVQDGSNPALEKGIERIKAGVKTFKCIQYSINRGKGYALRQGVQAAEGDIIIYTDIDFPYTHESLIKIYTALKNEECDLAAGIKDESYYGHVSFSRRVLSKGLIRLIRFFLSIPITDTQCGLKGFLRPLKPVFLKTSIDRYLFDLEFIRLAHKLKFRVHPMQIKLNENVHLKAMNYRVLIGESMNFIKLLFSPSR